MSSDLINEDFPREGQLLGVDYGTVRVGLAISTREQNIASPLEIYNRRSEHQDGRYFAELVADYRIKGLVVGLPMHVNGEEGESARHAREYGHWLAEVTGGLPILFWDERYTSAVAEDHLIGVDLTRKQRKKRLDMIAAQIILQAYLDTTAKREQIAREEAESSEQDEEDETTADS
ncbi:Holliday junction resolvase RuvX [Thalassoglobus sp.]|uniref:Holliday junction resolvase RuvX n=1 Tax=Thalassoglobus sp. TaxID=2795869 RepID=UPI003AA8EFA5